LFEEERKRSAEGQNDAIDPFRTSREKLSGTHIVSGAICYGLNCTAFAGADGDMRRRDFLVIVGGVAANKPLAARAQQQAKPVVGLLSSIFADGHPLAAFHRGLSEQGYVEYRNVEIEYRFV
jgi:hypothetical protein